MHLNHKKYGWKRGIAALSAIMMLLQTPLGYLPVMANVTETVSQNDISMTGDEVSSNTVQTPEATETQQEDVAEDEQVQSGNLLLNYAYIEQAQLDVAKEQNIMISVGEGEIAWQQAVLTLENTSTGEEKEIPVHKMVDNLLHFSVDTQGFEAGVYRVAKLSYSYIEEEKQKSGEIVFADVADMENVCFGLGMANPLSAETFTQYDAEGVQIDTDVQALDVNVVSLQGAEENAEAADKVAQAIEQADAMVEAQTQEVTADRAGNVQIQADDVTAEGKVAGSLVVMLDPGHDETHAGARANGLEEENLTLKVAEYCKEYLEKTYTDVVVYMTRPNGNCPYPGTKSADCNAARVEAAHRAGADVYVSLHFNSTASSSTSASGAMVFYPNGNYNGNVGSAGATLASKIIEELIKLGLSNKGIHIKNSGDNTLYPDGSLADYYGVIRRSKEKGIPAVIVEHAFLNNASDAAFLRDENNLKKLGIADAIGIAKAYNLSTEEVEYDAEDLKVTDIDGANGTFKITLTGATPVDRIANIKFKVYPTADKKKAYTYTATADKKKKGTYSVVANVSNHGKTEGKYKVIAYAYNAAGKKTQLRSTTATIEKAKLNTSAIKLSSKVAQNEKKVTLTLKKNANAASVYFKVYNTADGSKSSKKYKAVKQKDGSWKATVKISKHKSAGEYTVLAYSTSYFGKTSKAKTGTFTIVGPTVKKIQVKKMNLSKGTFQVRAQDVTSKAGVKKVQIVIQTLDGKKIKKTYTAKKHKSGYYYVNVNMKDYKYGYGRYSISVKVKDGNGIDKVVKKYVKEIEKPEPKLTMKLKSKQTKISMTASDLGIEATVKGVKFKVYHEDAPSKKKSYTAKKQKDGSYAKTIPVSDFKKSGKYKIVTYVKGTNGKYKKIGKTQTVTVSDIKGGKLKAKRKTTTSSYLYISDIKYKGTISKVEVKVWPKSKTTAKKTYTAKLQKSGAYRVTVDAKNHKKKKGEYAYQVTVVAKNGINKKLLKGTFTIGKNAEDDELYEITGDSNVTVDQMVTYYKKNATYPTFYSVSDAPTLKKFCEMYYEECEAEGIRAEVAFAQAMHETNFLKFGGDVSITQYNFAGIGATGGGAKGNVFATVRQGIRAQVQHLKAYANDEPLSQECVDPRFGYVKRGTAPYVEWLSIPNNPYGGGWATNPLYGSSIRKMIMALRNC